MILYLSDVPLEDGGRNGGDVLAGIGLAGDIEIVLEEGRELAIEILNGVEHVIAHLRLSASQILRIGKATKP